MKGGLRTSARGALEAAIDIEWFRSTSSPAMRIQLAAAIASKYLEPIDLQAEDGARAEYTWAQMTPEQKAECQARTQFYT